METTSDQIRDFMRGAMIENFERDGYLAPVTFFYTGDDIIISEIPNELLATQKGKSIIAATIKMVCSKPETLAAGMIIEAFGAKLDIEIDSQDSQDIISGKKKVSDLEKKQDIIVMIFSTPEKEELITYFVDPEAKKVGEQFGAGEAGSVAGTFSDFFSQKKDEKF